MATTMKIILMMTITLLAVIKDCRAGRSEELEYHSRHNISKAAMKLLPPTDEGKPLRVLCTVYFLDIREIDSKCMKFSTQFYFRQTWQDPRVVPYIKHELGIKPAKMWTFNEFDDIWKPDMFIIEEIKGRINDVIRPNTFLRIEPNGEVFWSSRVSQQLKCDMNFRAFPHDRQICSISFESYGYTANQISLEWPKSYLLGSDISFREPKPYGMLEFVVEGLHYGHKSEAVSTGNYTRLYVNVRLRRNVGYYMTKLYLPYIFLVLAASLTFWVSPKLVAMRLSLLLSVLLIMLILTFEVSNYAPHTSYVKAVDIWTGFCLTFAFVALVQFIFVSHYERKRASNKTETDTELTIPEDALVKTEKGCSDVEANASTAKFIARSFCQVQEWSIGLDVAFRYLYPAVFGLFNLVYWCVYVA